MEKRSGQFARDVLPAILYAAAIFTVSSIPKLYAPPLGVSWDDKIYHLIEYAGFSFLLYRALRFWNWGRKPAVRLILVVLIGAAVGALDELHQLYIRGRFAELHDWLADILGVVLTVLMILMVLLITRRKRQTG
jgi:VanZ family protein